MTSFFWIFELVLISPRAVHVARLEGCNKTLGSPTLFPPSRLFFKFRMSIQWNRSYDSLNALTLATIIPKKNYLMNMFQTTNHLRLKYPPGLRIPLQSRDLNSEQVVELDEPRIEPRIHKLHIVKRPNERKRISLDSDFLRKELGHCSVMTACARQRIGRRRAAVLAAGLARTRNLSGEWAILQRLSVYGK